MEFDVVLDIIAYDAVWGYFSFSVQEALRHVDFKNDNERGSAKCLKAYFY